MKKTLFTLLVGTMGSIYSLNAQQVLLDYSLEESGASTSSTWVSTSSSFGTSFCSVADCGNCGGPCVPLTGLFYAWFGGTNDAELSTLTQSFNVTTAGTAQLKFHYKVPNPGVDSEKLIVTLDNVEIHSRFVNAELTEYVLETINIPTLTSGPHILKLSFEKGLTTETVNVLIDDITLTVGNEVGVEEIDFMSGIKISTNATKKTIAIDYNLEKAHDINIQIMDLNGKSVSKKMYANQQTNSQSISTEGWTSGLYLLQFSTSDGLVKSTKIVVQ